MTANAPLPIDGVLTEIVSTLRARGQLVLSAAPGAGKTTRVPPALLDAGLGEGRSIVVLEPRRIAARAAAEFIARARGEPVGRSVGYRVRFERRGGPGTRLWFVTEGVFGRWLAANPLLDDVGVVVLDEFHERHLQGDMALAVTRTLLTSVRPDLRLLVMSATLDVERLAAHLGDAPALTCPGRVHPVTIEHEAQPLDPRILPARTAAAATRALDTPGDVLTFLPGLREIRRTADLLAPFASTRNIDVLTLHGDLPLDAQHRALSAGPRRRIVLATNVAETALTVEGVSSVVDSGLARVAFFDARHGINGLHTRPISQASAAQRAGRAGRLGPGRCIRLWPVSEHAGRRAHETPEILRLDLTRLLLELRAWGLERATALPWLDPPPAASLRRAETLLVALGALSADGDVTDVGRRMLALPVEPRVARMLLEAQRHGCVHAVARVAAIATERDILRSDRAGGRRTDRPPGPCDLLLRLELLEHPAGHGELDPGAVRVVERSATQLLRLLGPPGAQETPDPDAVRRCVLAGFADRLCLRRAPGSPRARMTGGTGVTLAPESIVREAELFVAVDLERSIGPDAVVRSACGVERAWVAQRTERTLVFDPTRERVVARTRTCCADLVLDEQVRTEVGVEEAGPLLAEAATADPSAAAAPGPALVHWLGRLRFLRAALPEAALPDPDTLFTSAVHTVAGRCTSFAALRAHDLMAVCNGLLSYPQQRLLDSEAPAVLRLPSGRSARIDYPIERGPTVAARVQELFGLRESPRVARGRVGLTIELLAPSGRPVQVTGDLASFWRATYPEVRRELRGRYPKHAWPEDPLAAIPTSRPGKQR